jgi:guanylate kinase
MTATPKLPLIITVSGPSGTGKDSVINALIDADPRIQKFIAATTRLPRPGDVHGQTYHFMDKTAFEAAIASGEVIEYSFHYANYYGTLRSEINRLNAQNLDGINDLNWVGVKALRAQFPARHVSILLLPPSAERLKARLTQRNPAMAGEGAFRLAQIEADLAHLHEPEYIFTNPDLKGLKQTDFDAVFVNDDLEVTTYKVLEFIVGQRTQRAAG